MEEQAGIGTGQPAYLKTGKLKIIMNKSEAREFLKTQAGNVWAAINELTLKELQEAREVAVNYSTTNCWFVEYGMKESFLKLINDRIDAIKALEKEHNKKQS